MVKSQKVCLSDTPQKSKDTAKSENVQKQSDGSENLRFKMKQLVDIVLSQQKQLSALQNENNYL